MRPPVSEPRSVPVADDTFAADANHNVVPALRIAAPGTILTIIIGVFGLWLMACTMLGMGLPLQHDELNFLLEGMRLPAQGRLASYLHGPFLYEVMAAMEVLWFGMNRVLGLVQTPTDHLAHLLGSLGLHLQVGRMLTLAAAIGCLVQVYRVGSLLAGRWAGVAATAFCASSLTFNVFSSLVKEDVYLWLFLLTAMDLVWRSSAAEYRRPFLAGLAVGAAFATKYFGVFGFTLVAVPLLRHDREGWHRPLRQAVALVAGAVLAIGVLFPFLLFDLPQVLASIGTLSSATGTAEADLAIWAYLTSHLPALLGGFVGVAAIAELVFRLRSDPRGPFLVLLPAFFLLAFLGSRRSYTISYHGYVVAIAGFLLAGAFVVRVSRYLPRRWRTVPAAAVLAIVLFDPAYLSSSVKYGLIITGRSTRALAEQRIESLIPSGACIAANGAVAGWNHFGPTITPTEPSTPETGGVFAAAERAALDRQAGPKYDLLQSEMFATGPVPTECDWYVEAKLGMPSTLELGPLFAASGDSLEDLHRFSPPPGFELVAQVDAFPRQHSIMYPYMTQLDLAELRAVSVTTLWRERRYGPTYRIYRRMGELSL